MTYIVSVLLIYLFSTMIPFPRRVTRHAIFSYVLLSANLITEGVTGKWKSVESGCTGKKPAGGRAGWESSRIGVEIEVSPLLCLCGEMQNFKEGKTGQAQGLWSRSEETWEAERMSCGENPWHQHGFYVIYDYCLEQEHFMETRLQRKRIYGDLKGLGCHFFKKAGQYKCCLTLSRLDVELLYTVI